MVIGHIIGLFTHPQQEWHKIRAERCSVILCYLRHVLLLAAIPPIAGFIGTTQIGWTIGNSGPITLTVSSALTIAIAYYLAMIIGVFSMGYSVHWMGKTYGAEQPLERAIVFAAYTATPLFLVGIMQLYPVLWLNMLIGILALSHTVYLLYSGLPIMMEVSEERGFLYASAILGVGLVTLVAMLAATAFLWGIGLQPEFHR